MPMNAMALCAIATVIDAGVGLHIRVMHLRFTAGGRFLIKMTSFIYLAQAPTHLPQWGGRSQPGVI